MLVRQFVSYSLISYLLTKDPKLTDFDVDLHEQLPIQKSHFFLLHIIEWQINTVTYA